MSTNEHDITTKEVSRRAALATAGVALAGMMAPKSASAASERATKRDASRVSFEIADYEHTVDGIEREENKSGVVNAYSSDDTYPTAKSVYELVNDRVSYTQKESDAGSYLFVDDDGFTTLREGAVDEEMSETSKNPLAGDVIYKAIREIEEKVEYDEKPAICDDASCEKVHIPLSGGVYHAYQEANTFPGFGNCETGITYRYEAGDISGTQQSWGVRKIDKSFMALCNDEFGGIYLAKEGSTGTWKPPYCEWHS